LQGILPRQLAAGIKVIEIATHPPPTAPGIPALPAAPDADKGNDSQSKRQNKGFEWMPHQIPKLNYVTEGKLAVCCFTALLTIQLIALKRSDVMSYVSSASARTP